MAYCPNCKIELPFRQFFFSKDTWKFTCINCNAMLIPKLSTIALLIGGCTIYFLITWILVWVGILTSDYLENPDYRGFTPENFITTIGFLIWFFIWGNIWWRKIVKFRVVSKSKLDIVVPTFIGFILILGIVGLIVLILLFSFK